MRRWQGICAAILAPVLLGGCDRSTGTSDTASNNAPDEAADGLQIYTTNCAVCHHADGKGIANTFPPLAGSEWVNGSPRRLIALTLDGVGGAQNVEGTEYHGVMPAWRNTLSDARIAAVLTYIRQTWGNASPPISAVEVYRERMDTAVRKTFWTNGELLEMDTPGKPAAMPVEKGK